MTDTPNVVNLHHPDTPIRVPEPAARKISEGEAGQFEMSSYVLIARTHSCTNCNAIQNFSDLHEVWTHPTKTALSSAKIMKAARRVESGFDIATVVTPVIVVPVCHECVGTIDSSANRAFPAVSYSAWSDTLKRKALQLAEDRRAATAARVKPEPGLDLL